MSTIGSLAVNVVANTEKFSKGMKSARGEVTLFGKAGNALERQLKGLFTGLLAGFAVNNLIGQLSVATREMRDLETAANKLGMGAGALGGLEHAALMASVSSETLTKSMTVMLSRVEKGDAVFKRLGLSVGRLREMQADEVFLAIADAINKLPSAASKIVAANEAFGKGGAGMLSLISGGSAGIRDAMAEAERMGLAHDSETTAELKRQEKQILRLTEAWKGAARQVAIYSGYVVGGMADMGSSSMGNGSTASHAYRDTFKLMSSEKLADLYQDLMKAKRMANQQEKINAFKKHGIDVNDSYSADWAIEGIEELYRQRANAPRQSAQSKGNAEMSGMPFGPGGAFMSNAMGMMISEAANAYAEKSNRFKDDEWRNMGGTEAARIGGLLSSLGVAGNAPKIASLRGDGMQVHGNAALEYGSAAAFSQEKRSQQASQLSDNAKQQLKTQQSMDKSLQKIDINLAKMKQLEVVNIA